MVKISAVRGNAGTSAGEEAEREANLVVTGGAGCGGGDDDKLSRSTADDIGGAGGARLVSGEERVAARHREASFRD